MKELRGKSIKKLNDIVDIFALLITLAVPVLLSLGMYEICEKYIAHFGIFAMLILVSYYMVKMQLYKEFRYMILMAFPAWFYVCCLYHGDSLLYDRYNVIQMFLLLGTVGILYPFSVFVGDEAQRKWFDIVGGIGAAVLGVLLVITYMAILTKHNLYIPGTRAMFGARYTRTGRLQLSMLHLHQYHTSFLAMAAMFFALYLYWTHRKKCYLPFLIIAEMIYGAAIVLATCRSTMLGLAVGGMLLLIAMVRRFEIPRKYKYIIFLGGSVACCAILGVIITVAYKYVTNSSRGLFYGLATMTSRTEIWTAVPKSMWRNPEVWLFGFSANRMMTVVNEQMNLSGKIVHLHNGIIQTMAVMGIPGMVLVIYYTISFVHGVVKNLQQKREAVATWYFILAAIPVSLFFTSMFDIGIFINGQKSEIVNTVCMFTAGYLIFTKKKQ